MVFRRVALADTEAMQKKSFSQQPSRKKTKPVLPGKTRPVDNSLADFGKLPLIFLLKSTHRFDRPVKDSRLHFNQPTLLFSDRDKINFRLGLGPVEIVGCKKICILLQHGKNIVFIQRAYI